MCHNSYQFPVNEEKTLGNSIANVLLLCTIYTLYTRCYSVKISLFIKYIDCSFWGTKVAFAAVHYMPFHFEST